jgi:hypothetical protein
VESPSAEEYPAYPHTPEEHRKSFVARARRAEEQLNSLSQDLYWEVAQLWNDTDAPTHVEVAVNLKKVFEGGMAKISLDAGLTDAAVAADIAARPGRSIQINRVWGNP